jgi:hypothetical protein
MESEKSLVYSREEFLYPDNRHGEMQRKQDAVLDHLSQYRAVPLRLILRQLVA